MKTQVDFSSPSVVSRIPNGSIIQTCICVWGLFMTFFTVAETKAQSVGIGTNTPHNSAQVEISSNGKGLLIPRMTGVMINSISNPAKGLMVYDSTTNRLMVNMGSSTASNWQTVVSNSGWSLSGNSGTIPAAQFIGTTDNNPLIFRINYQFAGMIDSVSQQTFLGFGAGSKTTSVGNTAFGFKSFYNNITGQSNTAYGNNSLLSNIDGHDNAAFGSQALVSNISGTQNVAVGFASMGFNQIGYYNTAVGHMALVSNTVGFGNTGLGYEAGSKSTTAYYNTTVGYQSGALRNMGYNNTLIGADCDMNANGLFNTIAVGQAVTVTASSQARIGNSATNSIGGFVNWSVISDGRYKKNISEDVKGIDFIMRLRPVTYQLDVTGLSQQLNEGRGRELHESTMMAIAQKEKIFFSGFIAQEVEEAARLSGYEFSGVDKPQNENDFYGLRYSEFVIPLVKAMQQQQLQLDALKSEIQLLKEQNKLLLQLINK